ncbi:MAG: HEPN domain-containing protein [Methanopyri archaeon]|jgi:uncharacterized protein (UPF0332 family)|nr:HEPN domain-containing protein [Methanopyri archaeon]
MPLKPEELERRGLIRRHRRDEVGIRFTLERAQRDLATAESLLVIDHDWSLSIAYNAMLQAGRALMYSHGYRPAGRAQHAAVVKFVEGMLGSELTDEVLAFERMRRKRHKAVYDAAGVVSQTEAENALRHARELVKTIETSIGIS